jgi:hypothetical protein
MGAGPAASALLARGRKETALTEALRDRQQRRFSTRKITAARAFSCHPPQRCKGTSGLAPARPSGLLSIYWMNRRQQLRRHPPDDMRSRRLKNRMRRTARAPPITFRLVLPLAPGRSPLRPLPPLPLLPSPPLSLPLPRLRSALPPLVRLLPKLKPEYHTSSPSHHPPWPPPTTHPSPPRLVRPLRFPQRSLQNSPRRSLGTNKTVLVSLGLMPTSSNVRRRTSSRVSGPSPQL